MSIRRYWPALVGVGLVIFMAVLPLLNISIPGILPTPTYQPGTLALLSLCMVFASLALSYNLLLGTSGMLSFGHALYFGAGAYGLGIALEHFGVPLFPGVIARALPSRRAWGPLTSFSRAPAFLNTNPVGSKYAPAHPGQAVAAKTMVRK